MGTILALGPVVLFVVMFVAFRNWGVVRDDHGNVDLTRTHLRGLHFVSWLLLIMAVALPVIARMEGKKGQGWFFIPLFIAIMGFQIGHITRSLDRRMAALGSGGGAKGEPQTTTPVGTGP